MNSIILRVTVKLLFPLILIASVISLFRGHNQPGGGFIGGLVAACAFIFVTFAIGKVESRQKMRIRPMAFIISGLICALLSFLIPLFIGEGFADALWLPIDIPVIHKIGTPVLFDTGVFLTVTGALSLIIFSIGE